MAREAKVKLTADATGFKASVSSAAAHMKAQSTKIQASWDKVRNKMQGFTKWAKRAAVVTAGIFTIGISQAAGFEKGLAEISTLMQGVTQQDMKEMGEGLRELRRLSGEGLEPLLNANYDIVSAGFSNAADSAMVLAASVKLGIAGVSDAGVAADVLTTALNSYSLGAEDATVISDKLFRIVELGKTTLDRIAGSLGRATAIAASAGVSLDELGAAIGALTASGLSTEESITALKSAIIEIQKPGEDLAEAFRKIGIESGEALIKEEGLEGALKAVKEAAEAQGVSVNSLIQSTMSLQAILPLTTTASDKFADGLVRMRDSTDAVEIAYLKMMDTFDRQSKIIKEKVLDVFTEIGIDVLPEVTDAMKGLGDWIEQNKGEIVEFFSELFQKLKDIGKWAIENRDLIGTVFVVAVIAVVITNIASLTIAVWGLVAASAALIFTPTGAVLVGLGLLAAAIALIVFNAGEASDKLTQLEHITFDTEGIDRGSKELLSAPDDQLFIPSTAVTGGGLQASSKALGSGGSAGSIKAATSATEDWEAAVKELEDQWINTEGAVAFALAGILKPKEEPQTIPLIKSQLVELEQSFNDIDAGWALALSSMDRIGNAFASSFGNQITQILFYAESGFSSMLRAWRDMLTRMVAELAAKAAIFGFLNLISGGTFGAARGGLRGFLGLAGFQKGGSIPAYAMGGLIVAGSLLPPSLVQGSDNMLIRAASGEYVIQEPIVRRFGSENFDKFNRTGDITALIKSLPGRQSGGIIGGSVSANNIDDSDSVTGGDTFHFHIQTTDPGSFKKALKGDLGREIVDFINEAKKLRKING